MPFRRLRPAICVATAFVIAFGTGASAGFSVCLTGVKLFTCADASFVSDSGALPDIPDLTGLTDLTVSVVMAGFLGVE